MISLRKVSINKQTMIMLKSFPVGSFGSRSIVRFTTSTFQYGWEFGVNILTDNDCPFYVSLQLGKFTVSVSFFEYSF